MNRNSNHIKNMHSDSQRSVDRVAAAGSTNYDARASAQHKTTSQPTSSNRYGRVSIIDILPKHILLVMCEWLFTKDLLEVGLVDRCFGKVSKEEVLWKAVACHLWKSALLDGGKECCLVKAADARLEKDITGA